VTAAPLATPVADPTTGADPATGRAVVVLARVEAVRLLRHPVVLLALAALAAWWLLPWATGVAWRSLPVLHEEDWATAYAAMPAALAALVAGNLAVLRAHRHGTEEFYGVRLVPRWGRTTAHLLAVVPLAVIIGAAAVAHMLALSTVPAAVGRVNPAELATGPALVLLLGAAGVLLGRLVPTPAVAPLAVVVVLFVTYTGVVGRGPGSTNGPARWLGLIVEPLGNEFGLTPDLLARPAGWHAAYLTALAVLVAGVALLRDRGPRLPVAAVLVLAVVGTVGAGSAQLRPVSDEVLAARVAATERPSPRQTCAVAAGVTYCTFATYGARIGQWQPVVDGVRRLLPPQVAERPLTVRQRVAATNQTPVPGVVLSTLAPVDAWRADDLAAGTPGAVTVGTGWGPDPTGAMDGSDYRLGLAFAVAARATGATDAELLDGVQCGGRAIVALWLAAASMSDGAAAITRQAATSSDGSILLPLVAGGQSVVVDSRDVAVVQGLLRLEVEQVRAEVHADWDRLTAPGVRTTDAAGRFDLPAPPPLPPADERSVGTENC